MKTKSWIFTILLLVVTLVCNTVSGQVNNASKYPDRIILNLQQEASSSIAITWRTNKDINEGYVELQLLSSTKVDPKNTKSYKAVSIPVKYEYEGLEPVEAVQHSVVLSNLIEGEKYMYRVGTDTYWSEWLEFRTPNTNPEFSFIYFGDPQSDLKSQWSRVVRKAYQYSPDCSFMLYAGDVINNAGNDVQWDEWFKAGSYILGSVPQVLTPGNHDYDDLVIDPHWKYQFNQPKNGPEEVKGTCFFVDYKNLKLISFDSATELELEDENGKALQSQKIWLDSVLTANTKEWVIVTTHLPFYSPKASRDNATLRKHFQPILEKHGVDLVLTGHDHSYGRGMASDNPDIKPSIVYVVSVSGPKLYDAGTKEWMTKSIGHKQLFQEITIDGNRLDFKTFSADGELCDHFELLKKKNGNNKLKEYSLK
ncbi:MAG: metallophosphoesterase family protein [Draconibacterium sp.]